MKVACIQPKIDENIDKCFSQIESILKEILNKYEDCEIVCLPERWIPILNDLSSNIQKE